MSQKLSNSSPDQNQLLLIKINCVDDMKCLRYKSYIGSLQTLTVRNQPLQVSHTRFLLVVPEIEAQKRLMNLYTSSATEHGL